MINEIFELIRLDIPGFLKENVPLVRGVCERASLITYPLLEFGTTLGTRLQYDLPEMALLQVITLIFAIISLSYRLVPKDYVRTKHFFNLSVGILYSLSLYGLETTRIFKILNCVVTLTVASVFLVMVQANVYLKDYGTNVKYPCIVLLEYHILRVSQMPFLNLSSGFVVPSLLETFAYNFHFPVLGAGPFLRYDTYKDFIHSINPAPHFDWKVVIQKIFGFLLFGFLFIMLKIGLGVPMYDIVYQDVSFPVLLKNMVLGMFMTRFMIYSLFFGGEMMCALVGYGYTGRNEETGELEWDNIFGSDVIGYEFGITPRGLMRSWNRSVGGGARWVVYDRLVGFPTFMRVLAVMLFIGAVHGVYPGYIVMWVSVGILHLVYIEVYRRIVRPYFLKEGARKMGWFTYIVLWIICQFFVDYFTTTFVLVKWTDMMGFFRRFYFVPQIVVFLAYLAIQFVPRNNTVTSVTKKIK